MKLIQKAKKKSIIILSNRKFERYKEYHFVG